LDSNVVDLVDEETDIEEEIDDETDIDDEIDDEVKVGIIFLLLFIFSLTFY
jgi:hypothetical protein